MVWISAVSPSQFKLHYCCNSIWHLLDEPNRSGLFLGFSFGTQTRRNFLPGSCSLHLDSWLIPHHTYVRYVNKDQISYFFSIKSQCFFREVKWRQALISYLCEFKLFSHHFQIPQSSSSELSIILTIFRVTDSFLNYSGFLLYLLQQQKKDLKYRNTVLTKTVCVLVEKVKREEKVSSVSGQTEQTSFCSWVLRDDSFGFQMTGIDMIWDFSTICNNDLFSEPTNCQVITSLGWKQTIFWHR